MARNTSALKRGWSYDITNSRMDCYVDAVKMFYLDATNTLINLDGIYLRLNDSDYLYFGDASDISITWDTAKLAILPVADATGYVAIGNGTNDMDVWVTMGTAANYIRFDHAKAYLSLVNTQLYAPNLQTSGTTAGLIYVNANGYLIQGD